MVVPAPGAVTIDGNDKDWDLSAGIWSYNDPTIVKKHSVWTHLMWDEKGIYLLARYNDLSPLKNATRGIDFSNSWRADAMQTRVVFDSKTPDEHQMHINLFYSTPEEQPYMIVKHGGFRPQAPFDDTGPDRPDLLERFGSSMEKFGAKIAFKARDNGQGYNLEAFWPWSYVRIGGKPLAPGDNFIFGIEAMWGSSDGLRTAHRLADILKNDQVNRIFFFRARNGWGHAVISAKGNLSITAEQTKLQAARLKQFVNYDTEGPVPIKYSLPGDRDVTIAIDNPKGERVRNLFGQYPRSSGKNTDFWDGLDDHGDPLPVGDYVATVVDHEPVQVKFINSVYNAATPPWATDSGLKLWGSNHGYPTTAATRGDITLIGFTGTEGGSGLLRANAKGIIQWADKNEILDVTIGEKFSYSVAKDTWISQTVLRRHDLETGALTTFDDEARSPNSPLPLKNDVVADASSIALRDGKVFVCIPGIGLYRMDPSSGKIEATLELSGLLAVTDRDETMWGLFADGRIALLDNDGRAQGTVFTASNLKNPVRLAVSQDKARFAISDPGTNQVFIYDAKGALQQTIGSAYEAVKGKRPAGKFIETDLIDPLGLDFDSGGLLWITEGESSSRRVSTWSADAKLGQQFWGGADYGAMAGFPLAFDSTRFVAHGLEFKLDPNPDINNHPTQEKPLIFHPELSDTRGWIYRLNGHEYAVNAPSMNGPQDLMIAKRDEAGVFRPVVRIKYAITWGNKPMPGTAWTDLNDNGVKDPGETVAFVDGKKGYWSMGWMKPDLTLVTADQYVYPLKGITKTGVPLYDFTKAVRPENTIKVNLAAQGSTGSVVMDMAGNISDGISYHTVDGRSGAYPNLYQRHDAPAARRGVLIAPFRTNGVVENVPAVGSVTALSGDRGEWFILSMDGIYLSSILQDSKGDVTLDETFVGQESFGGFFWRDETGRVLAQLGGPSYRIVEITGLDTTRKETLKIKLTTKQRAAGIKLAEKRLADVIEEPETLTIARLASLPRSAPNPEGNTNSDLIENVSTVRVQEIGDPSRWFRTALAHDGTSLMIAWQVNDSNPWRNGEGSFTHAFIGGDSVDLQLDVPGRGPIRVLAAPLGGKNTAIYWQQKAPAQVNPLTYVVSNNNANAQHFDVVRRLDSAKLSVSTGLRGYSVLLTIPLADLGIDPTKMNEIKGIVGVIFSDPSGTNRASRLYWHDKATGLVSDVPSESRLNPAHWGKILLTQ